VLYFLSGITRKKVFRRKVLAANRTGSIFFPEERKNVFPVMNLDVPFDEFETDEGKYILYFWSVK